MPYNSLTQYIEILEQHNELIRIKEYVNPDLEITEIADRFSKLNYGGKALLFENTGTQFPVLINTFGSYKRMCLAIGVNSLDDIARDIELLFKDFMAPKESVFEKLKMLPKLGRISSWMPKLKKDRGVCQEVILNNPDLNIFPILKCWPFDGGRFITLPMVNTKDPVTGIRNVGMYRMQIFDKNLTGMHWHTHKTGARHYQEYKKLEKKMPIAVVLGGDPIYTYSATAPLPDNVDEYMLAGFLRKKYVELVKCITNEIEVPADADIVIEGYVDPQEDLIWEGPFGDHTGFYSLADWYPKFHVTCITHRKNAVYPATIVGIPPMEDAWIGKATERIFLAPIRMGMLPEVVDIDLPFAGVAHNICIVKIEKTFVGHAHKVMNALWGAGQMMFNKILIVTNKGADIHDYFSLAKVISENVDPAEDIFFSKGPLDVLDHAASKFAFGGKMFVDATDKLAEERSLTKSVHIDFSKEWKALNSLCPEIISINTKLMNEGVSIAVVTIDKTKPDQVYAIAELLLKNRYLSAKCLLFVDSWNEDLDFFDITWITSANIDVIRDCHIIKHNGISSIVVDATIKNLKNDNFIREWPNPVLSDTQTINKIDAIWNRLDVGNIIVSPSLKYINEKNSDGAVCNGI